MTRQAIGSFKLQARATVMLAAGCALALLASTAQGQDPSPGPSVEQQAVGPHGTAQSATPLTPPQLDRLTAPIALYPDPLVAQILVAATYPLEVVEADRWLREPEHAALKGDGLAAALAPLPWDESVKALAAFPQILAMMDEYVTWTEELGDAFLAEQAAVMDSVQRLRRRAEAAGGLTSSPEQVVSDDGGPIVIEPAMPDTVYVPVYDPNIAFGQWPYPDNPPYFFPDVYPAVATGGIGWVAVVIVEKLRPHRSCDWRRHRIDIHPNPLAHFGPGSTTTASSWQHDPAHRRGVAYRDPVVRTRFDAAATIGRVQAVNRPPAMTAPTSLVRPAPEIVRTPPAVGGRPIAHAPSAEMPRSPVVLRGSTPVAPAYRHTPEWPAARLAPASRPSMPMPVAVPPASILTRPQTGIVPSPRIAPTPHIAPAPQITSSPQGAPPSLGDHR